MVLLEWQLSASGWHPTNTCPRDAQSVQNIILSDLSLMCEAGPYWLFLYWVIGWIRAKTKANIPYLKGEEKSQGIKYRFYNGTMLKRYV